MQSQPRAKSYAGQEHVKDGQFCKWLSNARDWSISRKTYWAARFRCEGLMIPRADRLAAGRIIGIGPVNWSMNGRSEPVLSCVESRVDRQSYASDVLGVIARQPKDCVADVRRLKHRNRK